MCAHLWRVFLLALSCDAWAGVLPEACLKDVVSAEERNLILSWLDESESSLDIFGQAERAICAYAVGDYAASLESINFVIRADEKFPFAMEQRGRIQMGLGEFPGAIDDFNKSILLGSGSGDEYYYIAKSNYLSGRLDEAIDTLHKRVDYFKWMYPVPENLPRESFAEVRVYSFWGEILYRSGDVESAVSVIENGYLRNTLSLELFDALLYLLSESDMNGKADLYRVSYCKNPLISSSTYCAE